ncbi:cadmium-translocating P-type ATPase [bacterium]|nr:cadmium-translocating P-type ATPase [bacterium]
MRALALTDVSRKQHDTVMLRLFAAFLGATLVFNAYLGHYLFGLSRDISDASAFFGALLLGVPVIIDAVKALINGGLHMEELVALAIIGCFALEDYRTAGAIAFIMRGAELIQTRTALGAQAAIEGLIRLTPTKARTIHPDGKIYEIPASQLTAGTHIQVMPGDGIAADGVITQGRATINESSITGESIPVEKTIGDAVFAGTHNLDGAIEVEVTRAGEDTTLGKVRKLILNAESTRLPIVRIIDRYVSWYTPVIIMIAGIILYFTRDMNRAITALVVTCPCALILSTPTAVVAALASSARLGILIKNAALLESSANLSAVVFDKTGTLTTGQLTVTHLNPHDASESAAQDLLSKAAAVAQFSNHPASKAVVAVAKQAGISLRQINGFLEKPGYGIKGFLEGKETLLGRKEWLEEHGIAVEDASAQKQPEGVSILYTAFDGVYYGWIGSEDQARPEAKKATEELYSLGIKKIVMLTGDRESVARKVANQLGCKEYISQCLPEQKLKVVNELRSKGYTVGVVGDGINDAPALAAGDIGIAMGAAGSDIAINSAEISLMNNDLLRLPYIIRISRRTRAVIYQNMIFGVIFIAAGLAASGAGCLNPIVAAMLHNVGSLIVICNSARLVRFGEEFAPHSRAS